MHIWKNCLVKTDHLYRDLNKALSVAKEIENAKHISKTNYSMANKHNYEALEEEKKHFRNRKKKD